MKALYKPAPGAGLEFVDRPEPEPGPRRREDPGAAHRHLRHRPAHREVGRLGRVDDRRAAHPRARVLRRGRRGRRARARRRRRRPRVGRGAHRLRHVPQLPRRAPPDVHPHPGRRRAPRRRVRRVRRASPARTCGCTTRPSTPRSARSSTRSATPCTPPSRSRSSAKTCSSPAAGPSASWPIVGRPARRRPLHRRVGCLAARGSSSRSRMGADAAVDVSSERIADVQPRARHARGLRRRLRDERDIRPRASRDDREHEPRRSDGPARPAARAVSPSTGRKVVTHMLTISRASTGARCSRRGTR